MTKYKEYITASAEYILKIYNEYQGITSISFISFFQSFTSLFKRDI